MKEVKKMATVNPSYIITLRDAKDPAKTCSDVLRLVVEIAADLSVNFGNDGIETASFMMSVYVPDYQEDLAKTLLNIRINQLMRDKAD